MVTVGRSSSSNLFNLIHISCVKKHSPFFPQFIISEANSLQMLNSYFKLISYFLQEADFKDMINLAQDMEDKYGYLFENIITNDDLALVFTEIRAELKKLEKEINWIPKIWA